MVCGKCGKNANENGGEMSRVMVFKGEKPTLGELADYFTTPGLCLCDECEHSYLEWLSEP